jgi:hypothetical protein
MSTRAGDADWSVAEVDLTGLGLKPYNGSENFWWGLCGVLFTASGLLHQRGFPWYLSIACLALGAVVALAKIREIQQELGRRPAARVSGQLPLDQMLGERLDAVPPIDGASLRDVVKETDAMLSGPLSETATPAERRPERVLMSAFLGACMWGLVCVFGLALILVAAYRYPHPLRQPSDAAVIKRMEDWMASGRAQLDRDCPGAREAMASPDQDADAVRKRNAAHECLMLSGLPADPRLRPESSEIGEPVGPILGKIVKIVWLHAGLQFLDRLLFPILASWIGALLFLLYRLRRKTADHQLEYDSRPPIVYLRAFKNDDNAVWIARKNAEPVSVGLEDALNQSLSRLGPFVGLGAKNEFIPKLGASRSYRDDAVWQAKVKAWMDAASWIVCVLGSTANLKWELTQIKNSAMFEKTMFLLPPNHPRTQDRRRLCWVDFLDHLDDHKLRDALYAIGQDDIVALRIGAQRKVLVVKASGLFSQDYDLAVRILMFARSRETRVGYLPAA